MRVYWGRVTASPPAPLGALVAMSLKKWFSRGATPTPGPSASDDAATTDAAFLDAAYLLLLGRPVDTLRRTELLRLLELGQSREHVLLTLLSSTEFRLRHATLTEGPESGPAAQALETALGQLGTDREFVSACYACLLGRDADEGGLAWYVGQLGAGQRRLDVLQTLVVSEEFAARYTQLCPSGGVVPRDVQLCELANPAKWDNPDWMAVLRELALPASHKLAMHRKAYEFTQTVWGLRRLGLLDDRVSILSVGAGHESLLYWLANHAGRVVATDLYEGEWRASRAAEGDIRVVTHPEEFAPFPYRQDRLRFLQMNGCALGFRDATFDVAYSLSSIEHFGGWAGSRRAVEEMARVVRPGGLVVLATEWVVSGPSREEVFLPDEFRRLIDVPGLRLEAPLDDRVWARYDGPPVNLRRNPHETPHMLVQIDDTVFTSVFVFLRRT